MPFRPTPLATAGSPWSLGSALEKAKATMQGLIKRPAAASPEPDVDMSDSPNDWDGDEFPLEHDEEREHFAEDEHYAPPSSHDIDYEPFDGVCPRPLPPCCATHTQPSRLSSLVSNACPGCVLVGLNCRPASAACTAAVVAPRSAPRTRRRPAPLHRMQTLSCAVCATTTLRLRASWLSCAQRKSGWPGR
jgi:hypothetical protein